MLEIKSFSHPYRVVESATVVEALQDVIADGMPFFLIDSKVAGLYQNTIQAVVPRDRIFLIEATEEAKCYEALVPAFCWLLEARCQRSSQLVVIGGGVLQDIGCFIASVLFRGIRWTLIPTTLLAQCDSCIGSKSSLNINCFKNQLGTFYSPHEVQLVFQFLDTLTKDEVLSGLGEAIKLHLIDGPSSVESLRCKLAGPDPQKMPLREVVRDSLLIKKRYIEEDEFDRGVRNLLNYGHTFAHAFESASGYAIPHGIAVTLGVACATVFSENLKFISSEESHAVLQWLRAYFGGYERCCAVWTCSRSWL